MKKTVTIGALGVAAILAYSIWAVRHTGEIRHIVIISIDTCRADYLSCYGYPEKTTPFIDAVAQTATRFESVVSPVPITLPAHSSMLTGLIPLSHGVHNNNTYKLGSSSQTLAELLKQNGFQTGAIVSAVVLDKKMGMAQGFDSYQDSFEEGHSGAHGLERKGDETTRMALDWLDGNKDEKSFLFLHYYDPHEDYDPPEPFASKFKKNLYAGEIAFTDHCIGRVVQKLKDLDLYDSTMLIITGDHGEMLGEHGEEEHTYFIYESAIKVPFILKMPGQEKGGVISQPVGLVDIVPTICSLLDIELTQKVQGRDVTMLLEGEVPEAYERFLYSESIVPKRVGASTLMAISTGGWKYIQAPRPELYNIDSDPREENNLINKEVHLGRILEDKLKETLEQTVRESEDNSISLDAESIKRLESLGYVAGKSEGEIIFDDTMADPKDLVHVFVEYLKALKLVNKKEFGEAKLIFHNLVTQCPEFREPSVQLGNIAVMQGDFDQSIQYYRRVLALDPDGDETEVMNNLAWIQATRPSLASGDAVEALAVAKRLCSKTKYREPHSLDTLAVCYAATGDFLNAKKTAQRALDIVGSDTETQFYKKITGRLKLFGLSLPYVEE